MENEKPYKVKLYNKLTLTCKSEKSDIDNYINKFILAVIGYKPNAESLLLAKDEDYLCPILCIFKALLFLNNHSFKFHDKTIHYFNQAKTNSKELITDHNIILEEWEENWITILERILSYNFEGALELFEKNGKKFPNDLLSFKIGMTIALLSGNKNYLKLLGELHYSYEDNLKDPNFIGVYSFILEELCMFDQSEYWVKLGLELDLNNVWTQHVYSHIMYQTNRIEESIAYLENNKSTWETYGNNFIVKHINWHQAIGYLESEKYEEAIEIIDKIITYDFQEAECPMAIIGFIIRVYLRTESTKFIKRPWIDKLLRYLSNLEIYTKHFLFDALAVWFISYVQNYLSYESSFKDIFQDKSYTDLLNNVLDTIKNNVKSDLIQNSNLKFFLENDYLNIIEAMKQFGELKFEKCLSLLEKEGNSILKIGGSDEQIYVLFEIQIFCALKCNNKDTFNVLYEKYFSEHLSNLKVIQKWKKTIEQI